MKAKAMKKTLSCILALTLTASMMSESLTSFAALDENTAQTADAPEAPEEDGNFSYSELFTAVDGDLTSASTATLKLETKDTQDVVYNDDDWATVKSAIQKNANFNVVLKKGSTTTIATQTCEELGDDISFKFYQYTGSTKGSEIASAANWDAYKATAAQVWVEATIDSGIKKPGATETTKIETGETGGIALTISPDGFKTGSGITNEATLAAGDYYAGQKILEILKKITLNYTLVNPRKGTAGKFTNVPVVKATTSGATTTYTINSDYVQSIKFGLDTTASAAATAAATGTELTNANITTVSLTDAKFYSIEIIPVGGASTNKLYATTAAAVKEDETATLTFDSSNITGHSNSNNGRPKATSVSQNGTLNLEEMHVIVTSKAGKKTYIEAEAQSGGANVVKSYTDAAYESGEATITVGSGTFANLEAAVASTKGVGTNVGKYLLYHENDKKASATTAYFIYGGQSIAIPNIAVEAQKAKALLWTANIDTVLAPGGDVAFKKGEIVVTATLEDGTTVTYDACTNKELFKFNPTKIDVTEDYYNKTTGKATVEVTFLGEGGFTDAVTAEMKTKTYQIDVVGTSTTLELDDATAAKAIYAKGTSIDDIDKDGININFIQSGATSTVKTYTLAEILKDSKFDVSFDSATVTTVKNAGTNTGATRDLMVGFPSSGGDGRYWSAGGGKITIKYEGDEDKGIAGATLNLYVKIVADTVDSVVFNAPTTVEYATLYEGHPATDSYNLATAAEIWKGATLEITTKGGAAKTVELDGTTPVTVEGIGTVALTGSLTKKKGNYTFTATLTDGATGTEFSGSFEVKGVEATVASIAPYAGELIGTKDAIDSSSTSPEGNTDRIPTTEFKAGTQITAATLKGTGKSGSLVVTYSNGKKELVEFDDDDIEIAADVDYNTAGKTTVLVTYYTNRGDDKKEKTYTVEVPVTFTENSVSTITNVAKTFTTKFYTGDKVFKLDKDKDKFTVDLKRADGTFYKKGVDVIAGLAAGEFEIVGFEENVTNATAAAKNVKLKVKYTGDYADETKAPEAEFTIDVEKEDYDIKLKGLQKKVYTKGEEFTSEGLIIVKDYLGQTADVEIPIATAADAGYELKLLDSSNKEVTDFTKATAGTYTVKVVEKANDKKFGTDTITIKNKYATAIKLTAPKKDQYYTDGTTQKIDWTDFNVEVTWSDGTTDTEVKQSSSKITAITATYVNSKGETKDYEGKKTYSDFNSVILQTGVSTFTVKVDDQTATFDIKTDELTITSVTCADGTQKIGDTVVDKVTVKDQIMGQKLDATDFDGKIIVEFNSGDKKAYAIRSGSAYGANISVTGYDASKEGTQTIKVNYTYETPISKKKVTLGGSASVKVKKDYVASVGLYTDADCETSLSAALALYVGDTWANAEISSLWALVTYASTDKAIIDLSMKENRSLFTVSGLTLTAKNDDEVTATLTYTGGKDELGEYKTTTFDYTANLVPVNIDWALGNDGSTPVQPTKTQYLEGTGAAPLLPTAISAAGGKITAEITHGNKKGTKETIDLGATTDFALAVYSSGSEVVAPTPLTSSGTYTVGVKLTTAGANKYTAETNDTVISGPAGTFNISVLATAAYASKIEFVEYPEVKGTEPNHPKLAFDSTKGAYVIKAMTYSDADEFVAELSTATSIGRVNGTIKVTMSNTPASTSFVAIDGIAATLVKGDLDTTKAGSYKMKVKYQNCELDLPVIVEENTILSLAIGESGVTTTYAFGQAWNWTGYTMTATLANGATTRFTATQLEAMAKAKTLTTDFDNTKTSNKQITFTYGGKSAKTPTNVAVVEPTIEYVVLKGAPTKTIWKVGETIDPTKEKFEAVYKYTVSGTPHYFKKTFAPTDFTVKEFDTTKAADDVELVLQDKDENPYTVYAWTTNDWAGANVPDTTIAPIVKPTASYNLEPATFTVLGRTPNAMKIKDEPTKVFWTKYETKNGSVYAKADEFKVSKAAGSVDIDYKDSAEITNVKFTTLTTAGAFVAKVGSKNLATPADAAAVLATAGTYTVDLSYSEDGTNFVFATYDIESKNDSVTGFKIVEPETVPVYTKGDALNLTGYYATITLASGREVKNVALANNKDFTVSKIDTTKDAGKQTITVKYAGGSTDAENALTATFDVSVSDNAVVGMKFTKQPTKGFDTYTTIDEKVVGDGAELEVTYRNEFTLADGTKTKTEMITLPNEAVTIDYSKVDFTKVGDYKATFTYKDFDMPVTINVTEAEIESIAADLEDAEDPIVVLYKVDATGKTKFATATGHINVTYKQKDADGKNVVKKVALKDIEEAAITGFDATKVTKDGKVTVTYKKATCTIAYTVTDTTVQAIKVEPAAFTFKTGETVDYLTKATAGITYEGEDKITTGTLAELQTANKIKIAITDADGKPATIDNTKAGVYTVTITSAEDPASKASATVTVTITAISLESFTASKNKISLKTTDTLATVLPTLTDFNFTAVYSDGTKKVYNLVADFDNLLLDLENVKWGVEGSYTATVGLKADQSKTATVTIEIKDNNKIDDQTVEDIPEEVPTKEDAVVVFTKSGSEWTEGNGYATLTAALDAKTGMGKATGDLMFVISKDITEAKALKFPAKATSITIVGDGTLTLSKATTIKAAAVNIDAKINGVLNVTATKGGTITIGDKTGTLGKVTGDKSSSKLNVLGSVTMAGLTGFASVYAEDGAIITMGAKGNVANVGKLDAEIKFTDAASTVSNVTVDEGIFHLAQAGAKVTKVTLAAAPTKFLDIIVGTEETTLAGGETVLYGTGKADVSANVVIRNKDANGNVLGAVPYNNNKEVRAENCELIDYTIGVGGEVLHTSSFEALFNKLANESGLVEVSLNGDAKWGSKLTIPKGLTSLNIIGNDYTITVEATAIKGGNCSLVFEDVKLDAKNAKGAIALTISTNGSLMSFKDSVVLGKTVTLSGNKKSTTLTLDGLNAVDNIQNFANVIVEADGGAAKKKFVAAKVTLADGMLSFGDGASVTIDALEGTGSLGLTKPTKKFKAITLKGATIANEDDIKLLTIAFEGNPTYAVLNTPGFAAGTQIFADKSKGAVDYTKFDATGLIENGGLQNVKGKVTLGVKN